jgi:oligopeptide transport system permease protein
MEEKAAELLATVNEGDEIEAGKSLWRDAWQRLRKNHLAVGGLCVVVVLVLLCFGGPLFYHYTYREQNLALRVTPPSRLHWLGTDALGRDLLARLLYGGEVSLSVGLVATAVSLTIGVLYGSIAGYFGKRLDAVMMRIVDIMYALPFTIFVILLMVFARDFGTKAEAFFSRAFGWRVDFAGGRWNMLLLFVAIGAVEWLTMARIVRGQIQALKRQEFIEAAVALGLRKRRIILRHMIPNVLGPVIVYATLTVPGVMLLEAFLSFLGLGVQPPMSSWGSLIKEGSDWMEDAPWILISTGSVFALTLFSLNFLGDGLRDALDVRASKD